MTSPGWSDLMPVSSTACGGPGRVEIVAGVGLRSSVLAPGTGTLIADPWATARSRWRSSQAVHGNGAERYSAGCAGALIAVTRGAATGLGMAATTAAVGAACASLSAHAPAPGDSLRSAVLYFGLGFSAVR